MVLTQKNQQNCADRHNKLQYGSLPFALISGSLSIFLLLIWFDLIFSRTQHHLYNATSMFFIFLASVVILIMSCLHNLIPQLISLILSFFYTQRAIVTYFVPGDFTYDDYKHFSHADIESAAIYYLLSVIMIFLGYLLGAALFTLFAKKANIENCPNNSKIRFPFSTVVFSRLAVLGLWIFILGSVYNIYLVIDGFAAVGATYSSDETLLKWFSSLGGVFGVFVLFSYMYFSDGSKEFKLARIALILFILAGLFAGSKGFLIGLALGYYLNARILRIEITKRFYIWSAVLLIFSIFIFFPLMTALRNAFLGEHFSFNLDHFNNLYTNALLSFSNRLGGFDWMTLWLTVSQSEIPVNASPLGELIERINSLVIGDLIEQPDSVNLSKLMVLLGRGYGDINELGGHAENLGGLATTYIFCGETWGMAYLVLWAASLFMIEKSHIHPFHKMTILSFYLISFLVGGGFILIHNTHLTFLILATMLALAISILPRAIRIR